MATRWEIKFKGLRAGKSYTIAISPKNYRGAASELFGAATPFEVKEDDNDNIFAPVRTSSGYIRIIDNGQDKSGNSFDWHDMVPAGDKDIKVTLFNETDSRFEWFGYIKAAVYTGSLAGTAPQERSFPVICPLTVLKGETIDPGAADVVNLAWLIYNATGNEVYDYYIQGDLPVTWLQYRINWRNFYDLDEDGNPETSVTLYDLLENVCTFLGLTARIYRYDLYLISCVMDSGMSETYDFTYIDNQNMYELADGNQYRTDEVLQPDPIEPSGSDFVTDNSTESYIQGWHRTEVSNDVNRQDSTIGMDMDAVIEANRGNTITRYSYTKDDETWWRLLLLRVSDPQPTSYIFKDKFTRMNISSGWGKAQISFDTNKDWARVHSVEWKGVFQATGGDPTDPDFPDYLIRLQSTIPHHFDHGMIVIGGDMNQWGNDSWLTITARLKVGDLTWDPRRGEWGTGTDTFTFTVGQEDYKDETSEGVTTRVWSGKGIDSNRDPLGDYDNYDGFGIPVSSGIGGIVTLEIINVANKNTAYYSTVEFTSLTLTFARERAYSEYNDLDVRKYTNENDSRSAEIKAAGCNIASWNGTAFGLGIIMKPDSQEYADAITYSSGSQPPEQHLCNLMNSYGSASKRVYKLDLSAASEAGEITPLHLVHYQSKYLYPVSVKRNWRDDIVTIKAIEI